MRVLLGSVFQAVHGLHQLPHAFVVLDLRVGDEFDGLRDGVDAVGEAVQLFVYGHSVGSLAGCGFPLIQNF